MIDIKGNSPDPRAAYLSNFEERHFVFRGVPCKSIEGLVQAFKRQDIAEQHELCQLVGKVAKKAGDG